MKTNILTLVITLVVGIVLAGSLLAPVISDAQNTLGDPITKSNDFSLFRNERYAEGGELTGSIEGSSLTLNDYTLTLTGSYIQPILGDTFYMQCHYSGGTASEIILTTIDGVYTSVTVNGNLTISANNGVYTFTAGESTYSGTYNKLWYLTSEENATHALIQLSNAPSHYYNADYIPYVLLGTGPTGHTIYYNGNYVAETPGAEITVTPGTELVEGTSNIYTGTTVTATFNGEPVTSNAWLLIEENVSGRATAGAAYSLVGAIPILVIVAIVMVAIGAITMRRND